MVFVARDVAVLVAPATTARAVTTVAVVAGSPAEFVVFAAAFFAEVRTMRVIWRAESVQVELRPSLAPELAQR